MNEKYRQTLWVKYSDNDGVVDCVQFDKAAQQIISDTKLACKEAVIDYLDVDGDQASYIINNAEVKELE